MLYFSELKGKNVYTEDNIYIGQLKDIIFLVSADNPQITKLVLKSRENPETIIPIEALKKLNDRLTISKNYEVSDLKEDELFLAKNLLDNQIIDIAGNKVVRVNDVVIQDKPGFFVAGVDIGLLGVLRWFGLENVFTKVLSRFRIKPTSQFLSWADIHPLELTRGHVKIKKEQAKLRNIRPEDLADYLEETNVANAGHVLDILDAQKAVEVISNLNVNYQSALFKQFRSEKAAKIIAKLDPEDAVDILLTLSKKKREKILSFLSDESFKEIDYLLSLSKTPIGSILTTEFLTVQPDQTVKEIVAEIQKETSDFYSLNYVYIVNKEKQLVGVIDLHELLLQRKDIQVYKFMSQDLIIVHLATPEIVVLRRLVKYKLAALPVVDKEKRMLGIVRFDDVMDLFLNEYE